MFLELVQSTMENRFEGDPSLIGNVVTVDVVDTRFIVVTKISESECIMSDIETDDNDIPHVINIMYSQDSEDEEKILDYIMKVSEEVK
tara:strand:- start:232 stop:495 length:264 start_codon:yes stop_codon:yes gene_type:complete